MLTPDGIEDRKWGSLPALRAILKNKELSTAYFGPTSVSDNVFERLPRIVKISLLACECEADIINAAQAMGSHEIGGLMHDLHELDGGLRGAISFIDDTRRRLGGVARKLDEAARLRYIE